jgi:hypothetical protein
MAARAWAVESQVSVVLEPPLSLFPERLLLKWMVTENGICGGVQ